MIRSMTAFARQVRQGEWGELSLELRSVNHRYLEVSPRMPEELRVIEGKLREAIARRLKRGKVDCNIRFQPAQTTQGSELKIDQELARQLSHASREIDALLYNAAPVSSLDVLKWPGVLQMPTPDPELLQKEVLSLLDSALTELVETREREGQKLHELIAERCKSMAELVGQVRERMPSILQRLRERLKERLGEVLEQLDQERVEQEMVVQAQRIDVDEEMDRLAAHLEEVQRVIGQKQPVGRRLDFLMQELNREANTLASKSVDVETTRIAVDMKVYIEQMREQIQNIE